VVEVITSKGGEPDHRKRLRGAGDIDCSSAEALTPGDATSDWLHGSGASFSIR
jgi:hypothetical protein